jgi:hypothetical protein
MSATTHGSVLRANGRGGWRARLSTPAVRRVWAATARALALVLAAGAWQPAAAACDPDGSGVLDIIDAANVQRAAVGLPSSCDQQPAECDADGNGTIDVLDAANALRGAVGLPSTCTLPRPTPTGPTPTPTPTPLPPGSVVKLNATSTAASEAFLLTVDYPTAKGTFVGGGSQVDCTTTAAGELVANDKEDGILLLALARATPLAFPLEVRCHFDLVQGQALVSGDLGVARQVVTNGVAGNPATLTIVVGIE